MHVLLSVLTQAKNQKPKKKKNHKKTKLRMSEVFLGGQHISAGCRFVFWYSYVTFVTLGKLLILFPSYVK